MHKNTPSSPGQDTGSPELWLTPIIGLMLLGPLIYHWRLPFAESPAPAFASDWRLQLRENIGLDIAIGVIPLFVTACLQRLLRAWKWHGWARGLVAGVIGFLIVGFFYYYALYPLSNWVPPSEEGEGNVVTIFVDDVPALGILGGMAVFASVMVTSVLINRRHKTPGHVA